MPSLQWLRFQWRTSSSVQLPEAHSSVGANTWRTDRDSAPTATAR
jgi:hypothetical protein